MRQSSTKNSGKQSSAQSLNRISLCFAGDSGDGIQRIGQNFSESAAASRNEVRTVADFPAEIRAPAGSLQGISVFHLTLASHPIYSTDDQCDVLIALNPAALKHCLPLLRKQGMIIVNEESFTARDCDKVGYTVNPLEDGSLKQYQVLALPITRLTLNAITNCGLSHSQGKRCKNFFVLGLVAWLFDRHLDIIQQWCQQKWAGDPPLCHAIGAALFAGFEYGEATELSVSQQAIKNATLPTGEYRLLTGNSAFIYACLTAQHLSQRTLFLAGYPITPASSILQGLSQYQHQHCQVFQAEDEIAAVNACIGAAFGGALAVTCTSGPGLDLKTEGLGLAVMAECPLVVIDVQRAGPSTGMPTKTEQSDLLACIYGRHGECPIPVFAPATPADCYSVLLTAMQVAIEKQTPVFVLSDTYLANASAPWLIPDVETMPTWNDNPNWVVPGMPGQECVKGGLETDLETHEVSCNPENHQQKVRLRQQKLQSIQTELAKIEVLGNPNSDYCIIGWGSTYGAIRTAIEAMAEPIAYIHLQQLWPLPADLQTVMQQYSHIIVAELNTGQLRDLLQSTTCQPCQSLTKVTGQAFTASDIEQGIGQWLTERVND